MMMNNPPSSSTSTDNNNNNHNNDKIKSINDWLPITSSRTAKWWYSTFHNVTAMVGAGVLALPHAMACMGWGPGVACLSLSWIITLYTLWQMVQLHELVPGTRFDRYHELGQHAFGEKLGLYIVVPQQCLVDVCTCIVYMVTGGRSLMKFHDTIAPDDSARISLTAWIAVFASVHFVIAHLPNFNSISVISVAAAVMSIVYSTIAWSATLAAKVPVEAVSYALAGSSTSAKVMDFFTALGDFAFAFAAHNVVLEIQATIPSTPEKPSKKPMWKGVIVAYIIVGFCYFPVAFIGYYVFGNAVEDNILMSLQKPKWLIAVANLFVAVHVVGGYQVFAMPVYDLMETYAVKIMKFEPSFKLRFLTRSSYVAITMFVGMTIPFFGALVGFFGGLALAPTTYFLPCVIWLIVKKPKRFGLSWFTNWICIVLGVALTILAPIGGLSKIILNFKDYKFYQ